MRSQARPQMFWAGQAEYAYVSAAKFADAFYSSDLGSAIVRELKAPVDPAAFKDTQLPTKL